MKNSILLIVSLFGCFALAQYEKPTNENTSIADQSIEIKVGKISMEDYVETTKEIANNGSGATELSVRRITYDPTVAEIKVLGAGVETAGQPSRPVLMDKIRIISASNDKLGINNFKTIEIPFDGVVSGSVVWYKVQKKNKGSNELPFSMPFVYGFLRKELKSSVTITSETQLVVHQFDSKQAVTLK